MGLGGYILAQSRNWNEIVQAPDSGAILVIAVGAITFLVAFFGCCGASQESQCMLSTYAVVVGLVFIVEVAGAILLLVYTKEVTKIIFLRIFSCQSLSVTNHSFAHVFCFEQEF